MAALPVITNKIQCTIFSHLLNDDTETVLSSDELVQRVFTTQRPRNAHNGYQNTTLFTISHPIDALWVYCCCNMGKFPFTSYSINNVAYLLSEYYNIPCSTIYNIRQRGKPTIPPRDISSLQDHVPTNLNMQSLFVITASEAYELYLNHVITFIQPNPSIHRNHIPSLILDPSSYKPTSTTYDPKHLNLMRISLDHDWKLAHSIRYACSDTLYSQTLQKRYNLSHLVHNIAKTVDNIVNYIENHPHGKIDLLSLPLPIQQLYNQRLRRDNNGNMSDIRSNIDILPTIHDMSSTIGPNKRSRPDSPLSLLARDTTLRQSHIKSPDDINVSLDNTIQHENNDGSNHDDDTLQSLLDSFTQQTTTLLPITLPRHVHSQYSLIFPHSLYTNGARHTQDVTYSNIQSCLFYWKYRQEYMKLQASGYTWNQNNNNNNNNNNTFTDTTIDTFPFLHDSIAPYSPIHLTLPSTNQSSLLGADPYMLSLSSRVSRTHKKQLIMLTAVPNIPTRISCPPTVQQDRTVEANRQHTSGGSCDGTDSTHFHSPPKIYQEEHKSQQASSSTPMSLADLSPQDQLNYLFDDDDDFSLPEIDNRSSCMTNNSLPHSNSQSSSHQSSALLPQAQHQNNAQLILQATAIKFFRFSNRVPILPIYDC